MLTTNRSLIATLQARLVRRHGGANRIPIERRVLALRAARLLDVDLGGRRIGTRIEFVQELLFFSTQRFALRSYRGGLRARATSGFGFARPGRCHLWTIVRRVRRFDRGYGRCCLRVRRFALRRFALDGLSLCCDLCFFYFLALCKRLALLGSELFARALLDHGLWLIDRRGRINGPSSGCGNDGGLPGTEQVFQQRITEPIEREKRNDPGKYGHCDDHRQDAKRKSTAWLRGGGGGLRWNRGNRHQLVRFGWQPRERPKQGR